MNWLIDDNNKLYNYKKFIDKLSSFSEEDIAKIDLDTRNLISNCIDPRKNFPRPTSKTGLAIGYIQSGKTSSIEALTNLARDVGYKFIIILSGTVGSLTRQTRDRIYNSVNGVGWNRISIPGEGEEKLNYDEVAKKIYDSFLTWENNILKNEEKRSVVIVSMKNIPRMKKIEKILSALNDNYKIDLLTIPALIIDDECDHASLNTRANQEIDDPEFDINNSNFSDIFQNETLEDFSDRVGVSTDELIAINNTISHQNKDISKLTRLRIESNISSTHKRIKNLRKYFPINTYVGYTATPYANLLINTWNFLSPDFHQLLESGSSYRGSQYFFPNPSSSITDNSNLENHIEYVPLNEINQLRDFGDIPNSLKHAIRVFLVGVSKGIHEGSHLNYNGSSISMMIHPSGITGNKNDEEQDEEFENHKHYHKIVSRFVDELKIIFSEKNTKINIFNNELESFENAYQSLLKNDNLNKTPFPKFKDLYDSIEKSFYLVDIIEFNARAKKRIPNISWYDEGYARILIGGQGLDRGYTVEGLTVSYLTRNQSDQMDTTFQRARFFGYHKNIGLVKLFITSATQTDYEDLTETESEMRKSLKDFQNNQESSTKSWPRFFLSDTMDRMNPTSRNKIGFNILRDRRVIQICRDYQSHLLDEISLENNQKLYDRLLNDDRLRNISEVITSSSREWIYRLDHKIILDKNLTVGQIFEFIKSISYEGRSLLQISVVKLLIERFIKKNGDNLICPIILMNDKWSTGSKSGEKFKREVDPETLRIPILSSDESINPQNIDRLHHYEYFINNSLDYDNYLPQTYPTLQVHNFDIFFNKLSEERRHELGVPSGYLSNVPYFSFYSPNSFFTKNIIYGYEDS